jgi:hypothetical protein
MTKTKAIPKIAIKTAIINNDMITINCHHHQHLHHHGTLQIIICLSFFSSYQSQTDLEIRMKLFSCWVSYCA